MNVVHEPTPGNVDTKADQVSHHQGEKEKGKLSDHKDAVQELKARINAMEQRLLKAGLLKNPGGKSQ